MPILFEPPPALTGGVAQVWAAISGGAGGLANPNWGGANIWASTDGTSYTMIGRQVGAAKQGVTTATLAAPAGANPDTVNTLAVSLAESGGALAMATETEAQNASTLCLVGTELLAYATATLTGTSAYALTYLERGLYGSTSAAHASGTAFARLDDTIFKYMLPDAYIGQTLYLKFQSFNTFGAAAQELSACTAYTITPMGAGIEGPVTAAIAVGTNLDYNLASLAVTESDDWGLASDAYVQAIDMGLASDASGNAGAIASAPSYLVAALPAGFNGALAFAANGCKLGESSGSGTGVIVAFSNGAWRRLSDDSIVAS